MPAEPSHERPALEPSMSSDTFREYYYLKEELKEFCKKEGLQTGGNKIDVTDRISHYLDTGEKLRSEKGIVKTIPGIIGENVLIGSDFKFTEKRREFFEGVIGKSFTFNVDFQKWLKSNADRTYGDAVKEYFKIMEQKKTMESEIGKQFEYNRYIRDFFKDNPEKDLKQAIICWRYKKSTRGHNRYENIDLIALSEQMGKESEDRI